MNGYARNQVAPAVVIGMPSVQILSLFVCIKLHDVVPMPGFLIFPLILVDTFINNILTFTMASNVHNVSEQFLHDWSKRIPGGMDSSLRKQLKACNVLRIRFGSNFVDRCTPLVIQDFCANQTMSLLLIKSSKV